MGDAARLKIKAFSSSLAWVVVGSLDVAGGHFWRGAFLCSAGLLTGCFLVARVSFSRVELHGGDLLIRNWPNKSYTLKLSSLRSVTEKSGVNSLRVKVSYYQDGTWGKKWLWGADAQTRRALNHLVG